jgi:hypothetical protein
LTKHDIEAAEFAHHSGNGHIDCHTVADVESRRDCPTTGSTNPSGGRFGRRAVTIGAEHGRALACQRLGSRASNAASRSRNQRHFARDPPHTALLCCFRVLTPTADAGATTRRRGLLVRQ